MSRHHSECVCCFTDTPVAETVKCTGRDGHRSCFECARSHVRSLLETQRIEITCMSTDGCTGILKEQDFPKFMDRASVDNFYRVQQRVYMRSIYGDELQTCPFCSIETVQDGRQDSDILICINRDCQKASCTRCYKEYHAPNPCAQQDRERLDNEERETYTVIKACPTCNTDIFRTGGCTHMTCTRCNRTMCYTCGEDINDDMWAHACPIYDDEEPQPRAQRHNRARFDIPEENRQNYRIIDNAERPRPVQNNQNYRIQRRHIYPVHNEPQRMNENNNYHPGYPRQHYNIQNNYYGQAPNMNPPYPYYEYDQRMQDDEYRARTIREAIARSRASPNARSEHERRIREALHREEGEIYRQQIEFINNWSANIRRR